MSEITHHSVAANGERFHVAIAGQGPVVYLLHGWPQTWYEWRHVIPELAKNHTVVAPDIRGLGASSRPDTGYDANTLGQDIGAIAAELGHDDIAVVGHDWGGVAAYACAAQHRDLVKKLAIIEMVIPGTGLMERAMVPAAGGQFLWHMGFQSVPDMPQFLLAGKEREYLSWFYSFYAYDPTAITPEDIDVYVAAMRQIGALRAGLEYYKAFFTSGEQVKEHARQKLEIPVLAIAGAACLAGLTKESLEQLAGDVSGGIVERSGHWMAEERPDYVVESLSSFL